MRKTILLSMLFLQIPFVANASSEKVKSDYYLSCAVDAAKKFGVNKDDFLKIIHIESGSIYAPIEINNKSVLSRAEIYGFDIKKIKSDPCLSYNIAAWHLSESKIKKS